MNPGKYVWWDKMDTENKRYKSGIRKSHLPRWGWKEAVREVEENQERGLSWKVAKEQVLRASCRQRCLMVKTKMALL